ncbi:hypothetical protein GND98_009295 [Clostridium butyricum]|uniref:Uncharacterized protein n=1 Tax=Clostridium butyricum TaxID=1492 RepID=A0A6L9ENY0_CLOBU|nr:hypothetical protein [Clostridium butyricum]
MNNNELKMEVILISKYCDIIIKILAVHKNLSVNKTLFFAYILNKRSFNFGDIYSSNTSVNTLLKCISQIAGNYNDYCKSIEFIIKAIHLLIVNKILLLNGIELIYGNESEDNLGYNNKFIENAINESQGLSDRQFLKEVINNV